MGGKSSRWSDPSQGSQISTLFENRAYQVYSEYVAKKMVLCVIGDIPFGTTFYELMDAIWILDEEGRRVQEIISLVNIQDCSYFLKGMFQLVQELKFITDKEDIKIRLITMHTQCVLISNKFFDLPSNKTDIFAKFSETHLRVILLIKKLFCRETYSKLFDEYFEKYKTSLSNKLYSSLNERIKQIWSVSGYMYLYVKDAAIDKQLYDIPDKMRYTETVRNNLMNEIPKFIENWSKIQNEK